MTNTTVDQDRARSLTKLLERVGLSLRWLFALPLLVMVIGPPFRRSLVWASHT
jgi:hypothetical protein